MSEKQNKKIERAPQKESRQKKLSELRQIKATETANALTSRATTTDLAKKQAIELTKKPEKKSGKLQESYFKKIESLKKTTKADRKKLKGSSIEAVRYKSRLLVGPAKPKETTKARITNLKQETARRIKAYSSKIEGEWITLDYEQMGSDKKDRSHEYYIGLGDILLDPDIKSIEVRKNGDTFRCKKGVTGSGRIGFIYDEGPRKGKYVATFTGDQYRILSNSEVDMSNKKEISLYLKNVKTENSNRKNHKEVFKKEEKTEKIKPGTRLRGSTRFKVDIDENKSIVDQIIRKLSPLQRRNAKIIEEEFTKTLKPTGLSDLAIKKIIAAAIINASAESGLKGGQSGIKTDRNPYNGREDSWGLFQYNIPAHVRKKGNTIEERKRQMDRLREKVKKPRENSRRVSRKVKGKWGRRIRRVASSGGTIQRLTELFCEDIERPKNKVKGGIRRGRRTPKFFKGSIIRNETVARTTVVKSKEKTTTKPGEKFKADEIALLGDSYANGQWNAGLNKIISRDKYFARHSTKTTDYLGLLDPQNFKPRLLKGNKKRQKLIRAIKSSKLIYLKLGGNEYTFGVERFKKNMRTLIKYIKKINPNAKIAIPEIGPRKSTKPASSKRLAQKEKINQWIRSGGGGLFRPLVWYKTVADKNNPGYYETKYNRKNANDGHLNRAGFRKLNKEFIDNFVA